MKLKAVYNKKLGQWRICHDQWCKYGETSIVATVLSSLDEAADKKWAEDIASRFNGTPEAHRFAKAVSDMFEDDAHWSVLDLDGAKEFFEQIGFIPSKAAAEVAE